MRQRCICAGNPLQFLMVTLLIATRNAHKVEEIQAILGNGFDCRTLQDFAAAPTVIEDASTFAGNATKKAVALAQWLAAREIKGGTRVDYVLADDSGLEVDVLGGSPGVHSARFAALDSSREGNAADADNSAKLLRLLKEIPKENRTGRFRCVLALTPVGVEQVENASPVCYANEQELQTQLFDGVCEGRIEFALQGRGGFGYDPLFVPTGYDLSFAELGPEIKNQISHRARALAKLKAFLPNRL